MKELKSRLDMSKNKISELENRIEKLSIGGLNYGIEVVMIRYIKDKDCLIYI